MQVVRAGFGLAEKVSPKLAAPVGQRMWFHVPPAPAPERRDRGFGSGETLEVRLNGHHIATHGWGSGPVVVLVHGWAAWWQHLGLYVQPLVDAGFRVVAFDMPSHGDSGPGRFGRGQSGIPDFADAVEAVARQVADGHVHAFISHSAGSMGVAVALSRGVTADRVVMVSPSVSGEDQVDFIASRLGWGPKTRERVLEYIKRRYGVDPEKYTLENFAAQNLTLPPALFVHDEDDDSTPPEGSSHLAEVWPGSTVIKTRGNGHWRILWAPETIERAVAFVAASA